MKKAKNLINTSYIAEHNDKGHLSIYYSGIIDSMTISAIFKQVENYFDSNPTSSDTKTKILGITIELLQNIYHHSLLIVSENTEYPQFFLLEEKENNYVFTISNVMYKKNELSLKRQLSDLNSCTSEEIKKRYQNRLKNRNLINEHAGLGWIDIRKKSGNPILYKFIPKGNIYSLFTVNVIA